jgi:hypothetical protein
MPSPPLCVPYDFWAPADDWCPGHVMLAANVDSIPSPPPRTVPVVRVDGLWAEHEWTLYPQLYHDDFPYLPWIRLPSPKSHHLLHRPVDKKMWRPHASKTNTHLVQPELLDHFRATLGDAKNAILMPFHENITLPPIDTPFQHPQKAYNRAFEAIDRLEREFDAWRDFVEVVRNAQRSLLELCAFIDWWAESEPPASRPPSRGAIFYDAELYASHVDWLIASFLLVPSATYTLDPQRRIELSPRSLSRSEPMTLEPLLHSLPHWYYPPHVEDIADFETAARGYAGRLDSFNATKSYKRCLDKVENRHHDEGTFLYFLHLLLTLMSFPQMAGEQRGLKNGKPFTLTHPTIWSCAASRTWDLRRPGSPNDKRYGIEQCSMSISRIWPRRNHHAALYSHHSTSSGVARSRTSRHFTTTSLFFAVKLECVQ